MGKNGNGNLKEERGEKQGTKKALLCESKAWLATSRCD